MHSLRFTRCAVAFLLVAGIPVPGWCLEREHFKKLSPNNYESLYEPHDEGLIRRQDGICDAIRTGDYEAFVKHAVGPAGVEPLIDERDFKKLVREMSYFTKRSFRRMHGCPKNITRDGVRTFATEARERGAWSLERLSVADADLVIYRTYLNKLDGNRKSGRIHVFYEAETMNVFAIFINRDPGEGFTLPAPDPSLPVHQGKDYLN